MVFDKIEDTLVGLKMFIQLVVPDILLDVVKEDKKDNMVIECALSCKADYIISGDKHLLNLKEYKGIKIITARNLLDILEK